MKNSRRLFSRLLELFSSMRFAVALLVLLAAASVIGTILPQNRPLADYIALFGPFWTEIFRFLGVDDVYASGWFVSILFFLVLSTALCLSHNTPNFIREIKSFRLQATESSLNAMKHHRQLPQLLTEAQVSDYLKQQGFSVQRTCRENGQLLIAGKKGMLGRLGYILTHGALILICMGGLLDSDVLLKMRLNMGVIKADPYANYENEFTPESRLNDNTLAFRSHVFVREGASVGVSFIQTNQGTLLQELPFLISLKNFTVKSYDSGMAKDYISTLEITDKKTGKATEHILRVNHPVVVDGISIIQSDSADGGSKLRFKAWNLKATTSQPYELNAISMNRFPLEIGQNKYTLEFDALKLTNIEALNNQDKAQSDLSVAMANARSVNKEMRFYDAGPSISYILRDDAGQGTQYIHYLKPLEKDGMRFVATGMRVENMDEILWLNLPLDNRGTLNTFFKLKDALANQTMRQRALKQVVADKNNQIPEGIEPILDKVLLIFSQQGLAGVQQSIATSSLKEDAKEPLYIAFQKTISLTTQKLLEEIETQNNASSQKVHAQFALHAVNAISTLALNDAPVFLHLEAIEPVNMSGLQLTRSPGKHLVYLGALLLVMGIYFMFYIRAQRVWLLFLGHEMLFAMSGGRHNATLSLDFERHLTCLRALNTSESINENKDE